MRLGCSMVDALIVKRRKVGQRRCDGKGSVSRVYQAGGGMAIGDGDVDAW